MTIGWHFDNTYAKLPDTFKETIDPIPVKEPKYPTPLAWLTPQGDQVWINYLNHWIAIKKSQGFFDKMTDKYKLKSL